MVIVLILALVGFIGYETSSRHKQPTIKTQPTTSHSVSQPVVPTSWLTYKSIHTPIQFSYPSDWKITHGQETGTTLENVTFTGTNGFSMQFFLEKQHAPGVQNYMCTAPQGQTDTLLNNDYTMALEERTKDVFLLDNTSSNVLSGPCDTKLNIATPQTDFTFNGSYAGSTYGAESVDTYLKLPEVQTAKTIFSSFIK